MSSYEINPDVWLSQLGQAQGLRAGEQAMRLREDEGQRQERRLKIAEDELSLFQQRKLQEELDRQSGQDANRFLAEVMGNRTVSDVVRSSLSRISGAGGPMVAGAQVGAAAALAQQTRDETEQAMRIAGTLAPEDGRVFLDRYQQGQQQRLLGDLRSRELDAIEAAMQRGALGLDESAKSRADALRSIAEQDPVQAAEARLKIQEKISDQNIRLRSLAEFKATTESMLAPNIPPPPGHSVSAASRLKAAKYAEMTMGSGVEPEQLPKHLREFYDILYERGDTAIKIPGYGEIPDPGHVIEGGGVLEEMPPRARASLMHAARQIAADNIGKFGRSWLPEQQAAALEKETLDTFAALAGTYGWYPDPAGAQAAPQTAAPSGGGGKTFADLYPESAKAFEELARARAAGQSAYPPLDDTSKMSAWKDLEEPSRQALLVKLRALKAKGGDRSAAEALIRAHGVDPASLDESFTEAMGGKKKHAAGYSDPGEPRRGRPKLGEKKK